MIIMKDANWFELRGQTIRAITQLDDDQLIVRTDAAEFVVQHEQECCESVAITHKIGDPTALVGHTVTLAEEDNPDSPPPGWDPNHSYNASHTWSVFILEAGGHRVEFWWLGESNGYYSETVNVYRNDLPNS